MRRLLAVVLIALVWLAVPAAPESVLGAQFGPDAIDAGAADLAALPPSHLGVVPLALPAELAAEARPRSGGPPPGVVASIRPPPAR